MEQAFVVYSDVVVCGAGTAGATAAIAAADEGAQVVLIEQFGAPGGSGTLGLVTPQMSTAIHGQPMCSYVGQEINRRMVACGAALGDGSAFDPLMLTFVLEEMLWERGVQILYHTTLCDAEKADGRIVSVWVQNKSGRGRVYGNVFIDATGDADLCVQAGLTTCHGDEETGKNQPVSLRYMVGGIDLAAFYRFLHAYRTPDAEADGEMPISFSDAMTLGTDKKWPLAPVFEKAMARGDLTDEDARYWQFFTVPGRRDTLAFNCPEFFDVPDATDYAALTRVQVYGKQAILRQLAFYRKEFPGFAHAYLTAVSAMVNIRESRRAVTDYVVTAEDLFLHRKFADAVCQSNYPVDVHGKKLRCEHVVHEGADVLPYFEIPFSALVVREADNLLVAGRNLGAEFTAQSAIRIIPTCRAMGEACGMAAAYAVRQGISSLHTVDGAMIRQQMERKGAQFVARA